MIFKFSTTSAGAISMTFDLDGPLPADIARHVGFAASLSMNRTGDEAARITRRKAAKKFIRRGMQSDRFFEGSFVMTKFASKRDLSIAFGISRRVQQNASTVLNGAGGLSRRATSLIDFETGEDRTGTNKGNNDLLYVSVVGSSLRPTEDSLLPRWAYPKALGLEDAPLNGGGRQTGRDRTPDRRGSRRGKRARENHKAFILRGEDGTAKGIFRRIPAGTEGPRGAVGSKRGRKAQGATVLEMLFATPKRIKIDSRLGFRRDAEQVMAERIDANFEGMLKLAVDRGRMDRQSAMATADRALWRR